MINADTFYYGRFPKPEFHGPVGSSSEAFFLNHFAQEPSSAADVRSGHWFVDVMDLLPCYSSVFPRSSAPMVKGLILKTEVGIWTDILRTNDYRPREPILKRESQANLA